jgi:hypothetical protein
MKTSAVALGLIGGLLLARLAAVVAEPKARTPLAFEVFSYIQRTFAKSAATLQRLALQNAPITRLHLKSYARC